MIGTVKEMILPPLVETEATAVFITGVVARGSAMGMVVTRLSLVVDGCTSVVVREGWVLLKIPRGDIDGMGEVK